MLVDRRRAEGPDVAELLRFPEPLFDEGDERVVVAEVFSQDQADLGVFRDRIQEVTGFRLSPK